PRIVALIGRRADDRVPAHAAPRLAGVGLGAGVAVAASGAVGLERGRAAGRGRIAGSGGVALVEGGADDGIRAGAGPRLAGVGLRAGVAVVAGRPVGLGRVRADTRRRIAGAGAVALIAGGASHRVPARAGPRLTGVGLRAGVAVAASGAVRLGRVRAGARGRVARTGHVALIAGGAGHGVAARARPR